MAKSALAAGFALAAAWGCGGNSTGPSLVTPPPPPPATRAEVVVSVSPASPVAEPSGDSRLPWQVRWTVVVRETAGLGGHVNFVDVSFVNSFGFETPGALNYGAREIVERAGTNRLAARGELRIPLSMVYRADGFGGRSITLKNAVNFTDDRGNTMNLGATATVVSRDVLRF
jgi:hypothetical protein